MKFFKIALFAASASSAAAYLSSPKIALINSRLTTSSSMKPITRTASTTVDYQQTLLENPSSDNALPFSLADVRKAIPEIAFEKNVWKSLFYMFFDYSMWGGALFAIHSLVNSSIWATLPMWAQAGASLAYWNVAGFFMWCIFVVGHDCGHTNFSNNKMLNDILGHITHGSILVPFYPWQLSHRRHHMFHNHVDKDYSYNWFTPDILARDDEKVSLGFHNNNLLKFFFPFYGWFMYLFGINDGSHFIPFENQRMWQNTPKVEYGKCLISAASVAFFAVANYFAFGQSLANMAYYYLAPLVCFGWWLITVTYLQHHHEDSIVYDEEDWKFMEAGFETVDRKFGKGIDTLHHHITDGHVAHHLFYTQIPHYNLPIATEAIKGYLKEKKREDVYRFENTEDFPMKVHSTLVKHGFKARRANPNWIEPVSVGGAGAGGSSNAASASS